MKLFCKSCECVCNIVTHKSACDYESGEEHGDSVCSRCGDDSTYVIEVDDDKLDELEARIDFANKFYLSKFLSRDKKIRSHAAKQIVERKAALYEWAAV